MLCHCQGFDSRSPGRFTMWKHAQRSMRTAPEITGLALSLTLSLKQPRRGRGNAESDLTVLMTAVRVSHIVGPWVLSGVVQVSPLLTRRGVTNSYD